MKNNTVINYESITSKLPNACNIFRIKTKRPYLKDIKGHIIVDHGTYAWIEQDNRTGKLKAENYIKN